MNLEVSYRASYLLMQLPLHCRVRDVRVRLSSDVHGRVLERGDACAKLSDVPRRQLALLRDTSGQLARIVLNVLGDC